MIVAVKRDDTKKKIIKFISLIALIAMFTAYYFHMSEEYTKENNKKIAENKKIEALKLKKEKSRKIEKFIYKEIETAVDLLGQEYIHNVKVIEQKVLITCETSTNIEPLMVRYGTMALVKKSLKNIKIAINLKYIVENKYNDK